MSRATPRLSEARLTCAAASAAVLVFIVVVAGALTSGYSYRADTVSRMGSPGQPFALEVRAGLVLYGLLVVVGATPLGRHVPGRSRLVSGFIIMYGVAGVIAGLAPKDLPGAPGSMTSRLHVAATLMGGAGIVAAMVLVGIGSLIGVERRASDVAAALTIVGAVSFRLCWGSGIYGLVERGLLLVAALWVGALGAWALADKTSRR